MEKVNSSSTDEQSSDAKRCVEQVPIDSSTPTTSVAQNLSRNKWRILRDAIIKASKVAKNAHESLHLEDDVRRFRSFGLVISTKLEHGTEIVLSNIFTSSFHSYNELVIDFDAHGQPLSIQDEFLKQKTISGWWHRHLVSSVPSFSADVFHMSSIVTFEDMLGFNNTGNVCVWPSEEVLAHWLLTNGDFHQSHRVCEIGGGMASLAGLAVALHYKVQEVVLTDGNTTSVSCINATILKNQPCFQAASVTARRLDWSHPLHYEDLHQRFDTIICADCCFFDDYHNDLLKVLRTITAPKGEVIVICPERSATRKLFMERAKDFFEISEMDALTFHLETLHMKQLEYNPAYDADIHFPKASQLKLKQ
eukprot:gene4786-6855_t